MRPSQYDPLKHVAYSARRQFGKWKKRNTGYWVLTPTVERNQFMDEYWSICKQNAEAYKSQRPELL